MALEDLKAKYTSPLSDLKEKYSQPSNPMFAQQKAVEKVNEFRKNNVPTEIKNIETTKNNNGLDIFLKAINNPSVVELIANNTSENKVKAGVSFAKDLSKEYVLDKTKGLSLNIDATKDVIGNSIANWGGKVVNQVGRSLDDIYSAENQIINKMNDKYNLPQVSKNALGEKLMSVGAHTKSGAQRLINNAMDKVDSPAYKTVLTAGQSAVESAMDMAMGPLMPATMFARMSDSYYDEAIGRGLSSEQARVFATVGASAEAVPTLWSLGKILKGIKSTGGSSALSTIKGLAGEGIEEAVMEPFIEGLSYAYGGNYDFNNMLGRMAEAFGMGVLSAGLIAGVGKGIKSCQDVVGKTIRGEFVTNEELQQAKKDLEFNGINIQEIEKQLNQNAIQEMQQNGIDTEKIKSEFNKTVENVDSQINNNNTNENLSVSSVTPFQQNVENMRKQGYVIPQDRIDTIEKFTTNRGANVLFDNTLQEGINGAYDPKTRTYKINPNSSEAIEFIAVHEMLHDMQNTNEYKELSEFVQEYNSKLKGTKEAVQSVTDTYNKMYDKNGLNKSGLDMNVETTNDMVAQTLGNQEFLNELAQTKPNIFQRLVKWIKEMGTNIFGTDKAKFLQELKKKFAVAYNSSYVKKNDNIAFSVHKTDDGTLYIKDEKNKYIKEDGTKMTPRELYNSLVGKEIDLGNGDKALILKRLPGDKDLYKELFTRHPNFYNNIDNIKKINNDVNYNIEELLQNSENILPNEVDKGQRHVKQGIVSFDTRLVNFYDGNNAYKIEFSIAKLKDGNKVAYAKRRFDYNDNLTKKIKTLEARSSKSPLSQMSNINNSIAPQNENVNTDIKYSMQKNKKNTQYSQTNDKWKKHLEDNFSLIPNATKTIIERERQALTNDSTVKFEEAERKKKRNSLMDIAKITKEDASLKPVSDYKSKNGTSKDTRQFYENAKNADIISKEVKKQLTPTTYNEITNKESMDKAYERLQKGGQDEVNSWLAKNVEKDHFDNTDIAEGFILLAQAQAEGNDKTAVSIVQKLGDIGTKTAQTLQIFSLLKRLTPEGMTMYMQTELGRAWNVYREGKNAEWEKANEGKFKLNADDLALINRNMKALQETSDQRQKDILLAEIVKQIGDKLPPEKGQSIKAYMRISMLFNLKTQVRNVLGNAGLIPVNAIGDAFSTAIDKAIAKKTGVRTKNFMDVKAYAKGFKKGWYDTIDDFKRGINTNVMGNRYEVTKDDMLIQRKSFNENTNNKVINAFNKKMNSVDKYLSTALTLGDRPFYEASFLNSIEGQMKANNAKVPSPEMIDIAVTEALERTWQDNPGFTQTVLRLRKELNRLFWFDKLIGYGLGDVLVPFAKTPANLTKAIVKYSPAGSVSALISGLKLKNAIAKGEFTPQLQKKFVDDLGKTFAGSLLYLIGYGLAQSGVISGGGDEDKDIANFNKNVRGIQPYSFKIGDTSFTYNWLIPATVPFAIMADLTKEEAGWAETISRAINISADTIVAQSFMASINKVINNYDGIVDGLIEAVLDIPARAIPTLFKQVADVIDGTARNTYVYGDGVKSSLNYAKSKIPFMSSSLPASVNTMGKEIEKYGGENNFFNVFLNPTNVNTDRSTNATDEIYEIYQQTGNKDVFPKLAPNYFTYQKQKITLTPEQKVSWQKTSGNYISSNMDKLMKSREYVNASQELKAIMIKNLVEKAYDVAKLEFLAER